MDVIYTIEHAAFSFIAIIIASIWIQKGRDEILRILVLGLKALPGVSALIAWTLHNEVDKFIKQQSPVNDKGQKEKVTKVSIPKKGIPHDELRAEMKALKAAETNNEEGKIFAYTYTMEGDALQLQRDCFELFDAKTGYSIDHDILVREFHHAFLHENALNPMVYPSLRRFEVEIVSMTADMLHGGNEALGFVTSGGTESILMAIKTYRDRAKKLYPQITCPEIVAPKTIHPAFEKAAAYFGLTVIHVPVNKEFEVDVVAMEKAITANTVILAASAPQFCHGVVDPIPQIAALAVRKGLPLHVDACFGGFMLPWVEKLGYPVPVFDFRNPGVTSMSADVHKYGYGAKGTSVIVYRNSDLRKYQLFAYAEWPGGLYGSPSLAGSRGGGTLAASWSAMKALGEDGYLSKAKALMETTARLIDGINNIPGLYILGKPAMTSFSIGSSSPDTDVMAVADAMEKKGYKMERQQNPACLHCSILPHHINVVDMLITDLEEAANIVTNNKALSKQGTAGVYGMVATIPDKTIITDFIAEFFSEVYK